MTTPTCPLCKTKFPGDPCTNCGASGEAASVEHKKRMPSATRRRRKHGRNK